MKTWKAYGIALAVGAGCAGPLLAQPTAPVVAAPAQPQTLWGFLGFSKENHEECKKAFCDSGMGQLFTNAMKPTTKFTGGLLPSCCPEFIDLSKLTAEELANLSPAEKAAAKIMEDEATAKARRAAVRYLGTVDCNWWKDDVEPALITALRRDRNECVRWEAAMALWRGCCCTKEIIKHLAIVVAQSNEDGAPRENSPRVIDAARVALEHCLSCYVPEPEKTKQEGPKQEVPKQEGPKQEGPQGEKSVVQADDVVEEPEEVIKLTAFQRKLKKVPMATVVQDAQTILQQTQGRHATLMPTGAHSLAEIAANSFGVKTTPFGDGVYVDATAPSDTMFERVKRIMPDAFPAEHGRVVAEVPTSTSRVVTVMPATGQNVVTPAAAKHHAGTAASTVVMVGPEEKGSLLDRMTRVILPYAMQDMRGGGGRDTYAAKDLRTQPRMTTSPPAAVYVTATKATTPPVQTAVTPTDARPMPKPPVAPSSKPVATPAEPKVEQTSTVKKAEVSMAAPMPAPTTKTATPEVTQASHVAEQLGARTLTVRCSTDRLIQYLQDDTYTRLRDFAVDGYKPADSASASRALPVLMKAAREDKNAKVRSACARCFGRMKLDTPEVVATLDVLKNDADANVRREAIQALATLRLKAQAKSTQAVGSTGLPGRVE